MGGRVIHVGRCEGIDVTEDGARAIVQVGGGDMRKVLNIFQTTSMGHSVVDAKAVYYSTGVPSPEDIDCFLGTLMSNTVTFNKSLQQLRGLLHSRGYALDDLLELVHSRLIHRRDIPATQRLRLNCLLADVDWRMKQGCSEQVQLAAFVGAFYESRAVPP